MVFLSAHFYNPYLSLPGAVSYTYADVFISETLYYVNQDVAINSRSLILLFLRYVSLVARYQMQ